MPTVNVKLVLAVTESVQPKLAFLRQEAQTTPKTNETNRSCQQL